MFRVYHLCAFLMTIAFSTLTSAYGVDIDPISPKDTVVQLFNGKNLDGLYTWLQDAKHEDPRNIFTVEGGMIHISGDGFGYVCTKQRYKDYHLVLEYRWGERTWQWRKTRAKDTGVIVHCAEPDGSCDNVFMAGIEAQIIEGGTGDFIVVYGKRADGSEIPVSLSAETTIGDVTCAVILSRTSVMAMVVRVGVFLAARVAHWQPARWVRRSPGIRLRQSPRQFSPIASRRPGNDPQTLNNNKKECCMNLFSLEGRVALASRPRR